MGQEILQLFRQSSEKAILSRPRIGTMLLAKRWITREQLQEALEAQRQNGQKLGYWLVKFGHITEEKLIMALSEQLRLPWMNEIRNSFSQDALSALPKTLCKRFNVFPLEVAKNNQLVLAVDYGFTDEMIEAVDEVVGCRVKPFVTKTDVLAGLINEHVEPQEDNTTEVIAEKLNFAHQVGQRFVRKWFDFDAEKARFGVFEDTLWVRYLKGETVRDHFILFDEDAVTRGAGEIAR